MLTIIKHLFNIVLMNLKKYSYLYLIKVFLRNFYNLDF